MAKKTFTVVKIKKIAFPPWIYPKKGTLKFWAKSETLTTKYGDLQAWNDPLLTQIRKYKEDDFSDSNAIAFSQDVCVHKIHFRHEAHTCNPRSVFPRLTPL